MRAALTPIDALDGKICGLEADLRRLGAPHTYVPLLMTVPGVGWIVAYTIACELGDIGTSRARRSSAATPGSVPGCISPEEATTGACSRRGAPATCAGPSSRRHQCGLSPRLQGARQGHRQALRRPARQEGRPRRARPNPCRRDLPHLDEERTLAQFTKPSPNKVAA